MSEDDIRMEEGWDPEAARAKAQRLGLKVPLTFRFTESSGPDIKIEIDETPKERVVEYTKPKIVNRPKNKNALF